MFKLRNWLILLCLLLIVAPVLAQDSTAMMEYTVNLSHSDTLGDYMVGPNGMTLYIFTHDALDTSNCSGKCLEAWPALTVDDAQSVTADEAISGDWGTITRADDSTIQVTYNGQPLYYWAKDVNPGDTTGQGVGNVWWVVNPATIYISNTADLGNLLVGAKGMTVYAYTADTAGTTTSACTDACATHWPAVTVADESDVVVGQNVRGTLGTIDTPDGKYQVTYNGWPLYYYANDAKRGDATGEGAGQKWYTVAPETLVISHNDARGDLLIAGIGGKTLYTFKNDSAGTSVCADDCAKAWPPLTVGANDRLAAGTGVMGALATITRADGGLQVTYNGMPLYRYGKDAAPGDATGQGIGDVWYVAAP
jgi:predicted lipoprotein with Yx(FWY)xxD motif